VSSALALVTCTWWAPHALAQLDFFRVRTVTIEGVRFTKAIDLVRTMGVDTSQSVWQPLEVLERRVTAHPLVAGAIVERRLPGTILVHVSERQPIALVPVKGMLRPVDVLGTVLPIDPARVAMDVPIAGSSDLALLTLLEALRHDAPVLYGRVSQVERAGPDELRLLLGSPRGQITVRVAPDVTVSRFRDILPVEADLARNNLRVVELDLRFRDQVIARQP
jgi:cell division protein FtsQ